MSKITAEIKYSLKQFFRNRQSIFFMLIFPILFLIMGCYMFGEVSGPIVLYYNDLDCSPKSTAFLEYLNLTGSIIVKDGSGMDLPRLLKDGRIIAYIEIPHGFGQTRSNNPGSDNLIEPRLTLVHDSSNANIESCIRLVQHTVYKYYMNTSQTEEAVTLKPEEAMVQNIDYIDFLLPGIIGIAVMGSAIDITIGTMSQYKSTGVFRKLATTPISRIEWNISRVISGTMIVILSVIASLAVSCILFGARPDINIFVILLVLAGSIAFAGLGMVVAYAIKDNQSANAATFSITLPMILISGSIFPVEQLPDILRYLSFLSPLTYLNNGLRGAMVTGDFNMAAINLAILGLAGILLFCVGTVMLKWKDD